jgi:hypothetical protein
MSADLEAELRAFLIADAAVAALVGERVYPAPAPQNSLMPFVTFQRISATREYTLAGPAGLAGVLMQIDCWADAPEYDGNYAVTKEVATAVRLCLEGYSGLFTSIYVQEITVDNERDVFEPQDKTRRASLDFRIWHNEEFTPR